MSDKTTDALALADQYRPTSAFGDERDALCESLIVLADEVIRLQSCGRFHRDSEPCGS